MSEKPEKKSKDKPKKTPKHPEAALYKALRKRAQDAIEFRLREHFETEAASSGFSSSFGPLTDLALAGPGTMGTRDTDARLARDNRIHRIGQHRTVHAALVAIPAHAPILRAAYGDERLPGEVYGPDYYGPFAGVALLTTAAAKAYANDAGKKRPTVLGEWLRSGRSKDHRPVIRQEADTLLREARACFQVAFEAARENLRGRGKGPKVQVEQARKERPSRTSIRVEPEATPLHRLEVA